MSQQHIATPTAATPATALPVIDLSAASGTPEQRAALHADLLHAATEVGFFHLIGHGVTEQETTELTDAMHAFFALPEAQRLAISNLNSPHFRGYTRIGDERTGGRSDWRDQLDIGNELPVHRPGPGEPDYWWLEGPNQWPEGLPALRTATLGWIHRLSGVARLLLHELLTAMGAKAEFYDPAFADRPHLRLKLVRYPGSAPDGTGQGVGAHKDYGFLTLLLTDGVAGLQVEMPDGEFLDVPPMPGAFVVNLGELLEVATDGFLKATNHRVVSPPGGRERYSVPFFYNPRLDAHIEPLDFPHAHHAPGASADPDNPLYAEFGRNELKGYLRAHPEVARRHHPTL
ncbi:isopenicillin N synthase family oxygenase [Kitasatospora sp. NBC_01250]|uniref:isopenicillin N synthase family dioxygenase n=1 Tax=Kitasatospora sp. NBC_01250 TaxID=2903571 RepID=UPI002E37852C|nr:2-oxoglutarate and iron-dependent oxygenase domain-containing protein [Kitasatospora sp. NBC_01250]